MTDPIVTSKAAIQIIPFILKLFKEFIFDEGLQIFFNGTKKYNEEQWNSKTHVRTLLHRDKPRYLYDIYQPQKLKYQDIIIKTESTDDLFGSTNKILIIGESGSGKSTLVRHLFLKILQENKYIPITIEFRYLIEKEQSLMDYLENIMISHNICRNSRIFRSFLKDGKFVFFFDGYDEIKSEKKEKLTKEIIDFTNNYHNNKFVMTSRPFANIDLIPGFYTFTIKPFENEEIYEFVKKQIDKKELQEKIINSIKGNQYNHVQSFLSNPLLLSMYIITSRNNTTGIPQTKSKFYRKVLDALFTEHDALSKFNYERDMSSGLSQENIERVMQQFAILSFREEKFFFDEDYVNNKFKQIKINSDIDFNNKALINDLKQNIGIWTEDGGVLSFAHKSLQEYYVALYILNSDENEKKELYETLFKIKNRYELRHFSSICAEIDKPGLYKYVCYPVLQQIISLLDLTSDKTKFISLFKISYKKYGVYSGGGKTLSTTSMIEDKWIPLLAEMGILSNMDSIFFTMKMLDCLKKDEVYNFLETNDLFSPSTTDDDTKEIYLTPDILNQISEVVPKDDDYFYMINFVDKLVQKEQETKAYLNKVEQTTKDLI